MVTSVSTAATTVNQSGRFQRRFSKNRASFTGSVVLTAFAVTIPDLGENALAFQGIAGSTIRIGHKVANRISNALATDLKQIIRSSLYLMLISTVTISDRIRITLINNAWICVWDCASALGFSTRLRLKMVCFGATPRRSC